MSQQQLVSTQQTAPHASIDPEPIAQSESPTAIILAIAILLSISIGSITQLVQVILTTKKP
ncbi:hypothetical protein C7B76_03310 [filamentous cyanobacterium CCP2]|nr:hypothetical protein C7B76_03310 [filamentous cyanobacterium CCP2]